MDSNLISVNSLSPFSDSAVLTKTVCTNVFSVLTIGFIKLTIPSDFHQQNLKGKTFKALHLPAANFSEADIRGANFTNATLVGANFIGAKAGLHPLWAINLSVGTLFLAALTGLILGYAGAFPALIINILPEENTIAKAGLISVGFIILIVFYGVLLKRGIGNALGIVAVTIAITTGVLAFAGSGQSDVIAASLIQSLVIAIIIAGTLSGSLAINLADFINKKLLIPVVLLAIFSAVPGAIESMVGLGQSPPLSSLILSAVLTVIFFGFSGYLGFRAMVGDRRYALISSAVIAALSHFSTNFRGANLTNADFTGATLPFTDFRNGANLQQVTWLNTTQLEFARFEGSNLADLVIRQLVTSKSGHGNYDQKQLQGLNLEAADLSDASFVGADLTETNLQNADLTRANLAKSQLYAANLTGACLTGACLEDWAISTNTKLDDVNCTYVYMRQPTKEDRDPWRKPDNRNEEFKQGDFIDFIAPIIKTLSLYRQQNVDPRQVAQKFKSLDLYHYDGIDPAAAVVAFKQLSDENPDAELEVVAMEGRGHEKVRLQAMIAGNADSSQLNERYFEKYRELESMPARDIQTALTQIVEKDERIRSLEMLLKDAMQQPKFYVETFENQSEFIMTQSKGSVNISGVQGNVSGVAAAGENQNMTGVVLGTISGTVSNTINQLPKASDPNQPGLRELLGELRAAIESEFDLSDEDKAECLAQVQQLAEVGQHPEDSTLKKAAKTALKILKGTVASVPSTAKLVESCTKLLPAIAKLLALI